MSSKEYLRQYYQEHREERLAYAVARRLAGLIRKRSQAERTKSSLKHKYNITPEQYRALEIQQQGECKICGTPEKETFNGKPVKLSVDHDHSCCPGYRSCGKCIRGLSCRRCNKAMGILNDNPAYLRRCAEYLESYA